MQKVNLSVLIQYQLATLYVLLTILFCNNDFLKTRKAN